MVPAGNEASHPVPSTTTGSWETVGVDAQYSPCFDPSAVPDHTLMQLAWSSHASFEALPHPTTTHFDASAPESAIESGSTWPEPGTSHHSRLSFRKMWSQRGEPSSTIISHISLRRIRDLSDRSYMIIRLHEASYNSIPDFRSCGVYLVFHRFSTVDSEYNS